MTKLLLLVGILVLALGCSSDEIPEGKSLDFYSKKAEQCLNNENWKCAAEYTSVLIKQQPDQAVWYWNRGSAYFELGWKLYYDQDDKDEEYSMLALKDFAKAIELRELSLDSQDKRDKKLGIIYQRRATLALHFGYYLEAIEDFYSALHHNPEDADFYNENIERTWKLIPH